MHWVRYSQLSSNLFIRVKTVHMQNTKWKCMERSWHNPASKHEAAAKQGANFPTLFPSCLYSLLVSLCVRASMCECLMCWRCKQYDWQWRCSPFHTHTHIFCHITTYLSIAFVHDCWRERERDRDISIDGSRSESKLYTRTHKRDDIPLNWLGIGERKEVLGARVRLLRCACSPQSKISIKNLVAMCVRAYACRQHHLKISQMWVRCKRKKEMHCLPFVQSKRLYHISYYSVQEK